MFTLNQINEAHEKVRSGTDFPLYIQELSLLGVLEYTIYVIDGHAEYKGENNHFLISEEAYQALEISSSTEKRTFCDCLKAHQEGKTDYMTFCEDSAKTGINKWIVDIDAKTCAYYDKSENLILVEKIPI